eukprot:gnl/MRDRNA2_/MRDRNA2_94984_c0_seq1.p1 gnl/MRDRNA2_/MRDRNA2_94984_c0~~gnl/MRDRNA2_/MRDRNA2_94984_c0_seq1.p1  ORF type:complete len:195 (-),score=47.59 gnl/MRDRNA2_/MRDRNA2_94984_c0_seq1:63-647(-)
MKLIFACILVAGSAQYLTRSEKAAVGSALTDALSVLSGNSQAGSKTMICFQMFPDGAPQNTNDATWQTCKDIVPAKRRSALLAKHLPGSLSSADRAAVGKALGDALGVMSGKKEAQSIYDSCLDLFPHGPPSDAATSPMWTACKGELSAEDFSLLQSAMKALKSGQPLNGSQRAVVGKELALALLKIQPMEKQL